MKKPFPLEFNGTANLYMLTSFNDKLSQDEKARFFEQIDLLERYMAASTLAAANGEPCPKWHEIIADKDKTKYPGRNS
jgi:hypothetical protein